MSNSVAEPEFRQRLERLEKLLQEVEQTADPALRAKTTEVVQTILEFHGAGLNRLLELVADAGEPGEAIIEAIASDELVGSVLLLHDLHPLDLPSRVMQALDRVRPTLAGHGGSVQLLEISDDGAVHLRLEGNCHGCPSSQMTLKYSIEDAIYAAAPDVTAIHVEGVVAETPPEIVAVSGGFVPLAQLTGSANSALATVVRQP